MRHLSVALILAAGLWSATRLALAGHYWLSLPMLAVIGLLGVNAYFRWTKD